MAMLKILCLSREVQSHLCRADCMGTVLTITAELSQSRMNLVHVSKRSVTPISAGGHTYCPASFQRLSAVVKGGKQDCVYSRKLSCAAVYLWRGAVHAAKAVGLCIVVVVSPPEEIECGHSGRVVVLANHRYDSSSAHLCNSSCVSHIRSALAVRHVYSPMSVVDIVQLACVSTVELYIPSVVYSFHWRATSMLEFVPPVCSMQVQLARDINVRICTYRLYYTQFNWRALQC
ncbi:hypothetical protein NP493_772g02054 [Ridgeia piscesae]|uniref:Uncharacterized protein n=1 Tax=Ridgeia piscesae TaxID=27915 RepID=A0AAD9KP09_RIDPI|nr:hypothetical protein NP493_772g02054 [Ridgeia piscesae]